MENILLAGGILDQGPGQLGGRTRLGLALGDSLSNRILSLEAPDKRVTQTYVLSFDLKPRTVIPGTSTSLVRARICWGSIKGNGIAILDIKHGTRVTLEGTILNVDAVMEFQNDANLPAANTASLDVYASIGLGSVGKGPQLTFTDRTLTVAETTATAFPTPIPDYAREIEMQVDGDPLAAAPLVFDLAIRAGPGVGSRIVSRHSGADVPITIPNGANNITMFTPPGSGANLFTPIYHLSL